MISEFEGDRNGKLDYLGNYNLKLVYIMSEKQEQTTTITWRPDYHAERLFKSDWNEKNGWDFVGCVVDIQLRRENGDYFFVKYPGSIEGIELDGKDDDSKGKRAIYHFGVEKMTGERWLFRPENIFVIRQHHSSKAEIDCREQTKTVFPFESDGSITKHLIEKLDKDEENYEVNDKKSCCLGTK